jgi:hypothetical protein
MIGRKWIVFLSSIPYMGWIVNILAVVCGLGAFMLWLFGWRKSSQQPIVEPSTTLNNPETV